MEKDLDMLLEELTLIHPDFKLISSDMVEVGNWVRWRCRYGYKAYCKHLNCPPYVPIAGRYEETDTVLWEGDSCEI